MDSRDSRKNRGFSLIEILVILVMVSILTGLAIKPLNGFLQRIKIQSSADGIRRMLLNARVRAVANSFKHCGVAFRVSSGTANTDYDQVFAFFDDNANNIYEVGIDSLYGAPFLVRRRDKLFMTLGATTPTEIIFRGDGSANSSGKIILKLNTYTDTVVVLASTGKVKVKI